MCVWSDITAVQDYAMHYMNAWLQRCVFNLDLNRENVSERPINPQHHLVYNSKLNSAFSELWVTMIFWAETHNDHLSPSYDSFSSPSICILTDLPSLVSGRSSFFSWNGFAWHFSLSFKETLVLDATRGASVGNNSHTISGKWAQMTSDSLCNLVEGHNADVQQKNNIIVEDVSVSVSSL